MIGVVPVTQHSLVVLAAGRVWSGAAASHGSLMRSDFPHQSASLFDLQAASTVPLAAPAS